jgi:hypothetical protein
VATCCNITRCLLKASALAITAYLYTKDILGVLSERLDFRNLCCEKDTITMARSIGSKLQLAYRVLRRNRLVI